MVEIRALSTDGVIVLDGEFVLLERNHARIVADALRM